MGVALYLLNSRLHHNPDMLDFHVSDQDIAEAVGIGIQTIKQQADRVRQTEIFVMPENYLSPEEKKEKKIQLEREQHDEQERIREIEEERRQLLMEEERRKQEQLKRI